MKVSEEFVNRVTLAYFTLLSVAGVAVWNDVLTSILPALKQAAPESLLRWLALFVLAFLGMAGWAVSLWLKRKPYRPPLVTGRKFGYAWSAAITYQGQDGFTVWVSWTCPKHKVDLGSVSANVPETTYSQLWCHQCGKVHPLHAAGDRIYVEQAEEVVRKEIMSKIRLAA